MKATRRARRGLTAVLAAVLMVLPLQAAGAADGRLEVVASGLDNPRGIAVGPRGQIYVAEAGKGGRSCANLPAEGESGEVCYGLTGAITEISGGSQRRVLQRLPSLAARDGSSATGPHDVSLRGSGSLDITMGLGFERTSEQVVQAFGHRAGLLGTVLQAPPGGPVHVAADMFAFEASNNPDGDVVDTNPYGVLARPGDRSVVADAGGNDLLRVGPNGVSVLAVFPPQMVDAPPFLGLPPGAQIPAQSVPTSLAQGPDGAFYVGELTGFPFAKGRARVWRVVPGQAPAVFATGFTNIIDVTFGPNGGMYVLELVKNGLLQAGTDPSGALTRIGRDGSRTEVASEGLVFPGGVAVADNGSVYVTNFSASPGQGQVVRIRG